VLILASCAVVTLLLLVCLPAGGAAYLVGSIWYEETQGPYFNSTRPADLDGDGDLDMVVFPLREESETIQWGGLALYSNQGNGQFEYFQPELPPYLYITGDSGDLDRDGDVDLLLLSPGMLMLLRNQGGEQQGIEGQFQVDGEIHPEFDTGTPGLLQLADLDGDELLDAFIGGCCGMQIGWEDGSDTYLQPVSWSWLNSGEPGDFDVRQYPFLNDVHLRDTALGDLDGDGHLDAWAAIQAPRQGTAGELADRVLLNDGAGNLFDSGQRLFTGGSRAVALGDVDSDGDLDALTGMDTGIFLWFNQAGRQGGQAGIFLRSEQALPGELVKRLFLEDLDGDGDLDALAAGAEEARLWWNDDGLGHFTADSQRLDYLERQGVGLGDFNGDGALDFFAGASQNRYQLWWNNGQGRFEPAR
jgi:hypothetical protein